VCEDGRRIEEGSALTEVLKLRGGCRWWNVRDCLRLGISVQVRIKQLITNHENWVL
jgi:hypothetical protein